MIEKIKNFTPTVAKTAFIHKTAVVAGKVKIGENASIWPCVVMRGDIDEIIIGKNSNIQDGSVVHVNHGSPTIVGEGTTVGHGVVLHGATVGDNCLIGMNAVVLESEIGNNCIIGAGSVLTAGKKIPPGSLVMGVPAKIMRQLSEDEINGVLKNAKEYLELAKVFKEESQEVLL